MVNTLSEENNAQLDLALEHYNKGNISRARQLMDGILAAEPDNIPALHFSGVISSMEGRHRDAIDYFSKALLTLPDSTDILLNLAMSQKAEGLMDDAEVTVRKVVALSDNIAEAYILLGHIIKEKAIPALRFGDGIEFKELHPHTHGMVLYGVSPDRKYHFKVEIDHHPNKLNSLEEEFKVMQYLNDKNCITCPQAYKYGTITVDQLMTVANEPVQKILRNAKLNEFPYIIQEFIESTPSVNIGDIFLAVLEQKALGVYQADLKPDNIRFVSETGIPYLVDYDQAVYLTEEQVQMDNVEFVNWCNDYAKERFNFVHFMQYFENVDVEHDVLPLFRNGSFNLGNTTLYKSQETTLAACGIYHTIKTDKIFSDGERTLDERTQFLDQIDFSKGERILDVGCNAGLLSMYLHDRGCNVKGVELDPYIIRGAKIISHILNKNIVFACHDLDAGENLGEFDTVMLFSVIHHTQNMNENAARLAGSCNRIIIECRLRENGAKPRADGSWTQTTVWNYNTVDELVAGLENLFPGFKLKTNYGQVDRDRYIMEFVK